MASTLRRWQVAVAGLALAGTGLLFALRGQGRNAFPEPSALAEASQPSPAAPVTVPAIADPKPTGHETARETLALPRSPSRSAWRGNQGVRVLVRRAGEHRGAPGIPVYFLENSMCGDDRTDLDGQALRRGLCFTTDSSGIAVVPEPVGDFRVLAIEDGWFGRGTDYRPGRDMEVLLVRDELLRVRVVDEGKEPVAGVPVRLFTRADSMTSGWVHEVVESSEGGIATLHPRRANGRGDWFVSLAIDDPDPEELAVDPRALPRDPLVLVLPEHGSVEVVVTDREGRPGLRVERAHLEFENEAGSPARRLDPPALRELELEEGRTTFAHVRADVLFAVKAAGLESPLVYVRPGERRTVTLVDPQAGPSVVARVLEAPGVPYADGLVRVRNLNEPLAWQSGHVERTDPEGRLRWSFSDAGTGRTLPFEVASADRFGPPLSARVEMAPQDGESDLGDLLLLPTPVLVSGVVVGEDGTPIDGAEVQCGVPRADLGGEPEWRSDLAALTDAAGTFVIHADAGNAALVLSVTRTGYASRRDVPARAGATDVRVVLAKHARIVGRVLVSSFQDRMALEVVARAERSGDVYRGTMLSGDTGFEIPALPAGEYTVWLRWRPGAENLTLRRIPVSVAAGATATSPLLDPIDLRAELHDVELQLELPRGSKLTEAQLTLRDSSLGERSETLSTRVYGPATVHRLRVPWASTDIEVRATGLRVATVRGVREKERVALEPGIAVLLRLTDEDARALEGIDASFEMSLQTQAESESPITRRYEPWDPRAGTEFAMSESGTYRAIVRVTLQRHEFLPITETFLFDAIAVDEAHAGTPVELTLPREARQFLGR